MHVGCLEGVQGVSQVGLEFISLNPLRPDVWERSVGPGGGPQGPPYNDNEGVVFDTKMLFRDWAFIEMELRCEKLGKNSRPSFPKPG